ncbi:MAG: helix-turn-helix domain-containing protein [Acidobacteria bacterium]|nr:helix-turn-helix domain-containing protein [Acidobacteriota bacterium]
MIPLLTKKEVAGLLRVSTRTVDRLCRARLLRFRLAGSRKRFTYADLESYLSSRSFGHPSDLSSTR